jgi:DNA-binding Lrp family transcriptional regulator
MKKPEAKMKELLELLEKNNKLTPKQLSVILDKKEEDIAAQIRKFEEDGVIIGNNALINWDKVDCERVTALIEVKVSPQMGHGFDSIAKKIYKYPQVKSCYLMSGGFDLTVVVEGADLKEVAFFVNEKLATIDCVLSTATHFILKKYKDREVIIENAAGDDREAIIL